MSTLPARVSVMLALPHWSTISSLAVKVIRSPSSVTSTGNNASFRVYHPDTTVARGANGLPVIAGRTLADAGANDNAVAWIGSLPGPGNYLIAVGAKSGSATFSLTVTLQ